MSLPGILMGFAAAAPNRLELGPRMKAWTPISTQFLALFSYRREMSIDDNARYIEVRTRRLWFLYSRRTIRYDDIDYIDVDHDATPIGFDVLTAQAEELERYRVWLVLREPRERIPLFSFVGEPLAPAPIWMREDGDDDNVSHQKRGFHAFIEDLKRHLDTTIGPHVTPADGVRDNDYTCADCGRPGFLGQERCTYCGGDLVRK